MSELLNLQKHYKISAKMAELLLYLARNDVATTAMIESEIAADAKSAMHRLRDKVTPHGIEIHSLYATGYWLNPEDQAKVLQVADPTITPSQGDTE